MEYKLISSSLIEAHVQFSGKLHNNNVIWDTTIITLRSITQPNKNTGIRQYIDITEMKDKLTPISIALNVKTISKPEILKTIIMIKNYKNLCQGRLEFGEEHFF